MGDQHRGQQLADNSMSALGQTGVALGQQAAALGGLGTARDPYLKITVTGSDGTKPESTLVQPITIVVPRVLSLRVATLYLMEAISKAIKASAKDALKAIGLK